MIAGRSASAPLGVNGTGFLVGPRSLLLLHLDALSAIKALTQRAGPRLERANPV